MRTDGENNINDESLLQVKREVTLKLHITVPIVVLGVGILCIKSLYLSLSSHGGL